MENNIIILILLIVIALLFNNIFSFIFVIILGIVVFYYYNTTKIGKEVKVVKVEGFMDGLKERILNMYNPQEKLPIPEINKNFMDMKFHTDYRDVLTGINNIIAEKKHVFNENNLPTDYSEPNESEIMPLITSFITLLNENIKSQVPNYIHANTGWDEQIPYPNVDKSGWDKAQEALGLQPSLYSKPAIKSTVELLKIKSIEKYETTDEIKYIVQIIIQKMNVDDQMLLCINFIQNKKNEAEVIIENIFVVGYLTKYVHNINKEDSDINNINDIIHYDFNQLDKDDILDPKYVRHELTQKYEERIQDMKDVRNKFDDETKQFYDSLYPIK